VRACIVAWSMTGTSPDREERTGGSARKGSQREIPFVGKPLVERRELSPSTILMLERRFLVVSPWHERVREADAACGTTLSITSQ
jgi:hypothetical protein